jgi:hypothetical protein
MGSTVLEYAAGEQGVFYLKTKRNNGEKFKVGDCVLQTQYAAQRRICVPAE